MRSTLLASAFALTFAAAAMTGPSPAVAQCTTLLETDAILNWQGAESTFFGGEVAIEGHIAVVGQSAHDSLDRLDSGAAYVYTRASAGAPWVIEQTLIPADLTTGDYFGTAVAIHNGYLVIGASGANPAAAYVYVRVGTVWTQQAKLIGPAGGSHGFGSSVAINQNSIAVGEPYYSTFRGRAHVFTRSGSTWTLQRTFNPEVSVIEGGFGRSIAISGPTLAIGQEGTVRFPGTGVEYVGLGEVVVWSRSGTTWTMQDRVQPTDQTETDNFSSSISLVGSTLLVGASRARINGQSVGAAYYFRPSGSEWIQQDRMNPPNPTDFGSFGGSVALNDTTFAIVGDPFAGSGAVYHYLLTTSGAVHRGTIELPMFTVGSLGGSVAVAGIFPNQTIFAGAAGTATPRNLQAGAALSFELNTSAWDGTSERVLEPITSGDNFGYALAIDGNFAVIGAPLADSTYGPDAGEAHVYEKIAGIWTYVQTLDASILAEFDNFGSSVAISGELIVIGAPRDNITAGSNAGSVFTYYRNPDGSWSRQARLNASDAASADLFGTSVALKGTRLVVGAPGDDNANGVDAGAAYIYTRVGLGWTNEVKLRSQDLAAGDELGFAVAVADANRVLVGSYRDDNAGGVDAGAVYAFELTPIVNGQAWLQDEKLLPTDGGGGDNFGYQIAVSGSNAVISSFGDDNAFGVNAGAAYVFNFSVSPFNPGWSQTAKLLAVAGAANDLFGASVAIDGLSIVVGMPYFTDARGRTGSAFEFYSQNGVWGPPQRLLPVNRAAGDLIGFSVAVSGDSIFLGAPTDNYDGSDDSGAVWHYNVNIFDPEITNQPDDLSACAVGVAVLAVSTSGNTPFTYDWQRQNPTNPSVWLSMTNGVLAGVGTVSGAQSATLSLSNLAPGAATNYRVRIANSCGFTISRTTSLEICFADFNCSGAATVQDIFDFLAAFFANSASADYNDSGDVSVQDIFDYLAAYFAGCS
ncbi:MAG: hypothetical protein SH850_17260 [Planctomycetaceae bacterium]|nr:hypothetical protein [Planctomycetaceae bacterium]